MVITESLPHVFYVGLIVAGIYYFYSALQVAVSGIAALIGGVYFQSIEVAYALLILTIPQVVVAIVVGWLLGTWLFDD
ncbi:MAG: hypothetical protein H6985_18470 [Pseudomonadales bacterium]|nr:hypothetical protein [Pseudomonadales bacterium]